MAGSRDGRAAGTIFLRQELTAENRLDAERREQIPGDRGAGEPLGLVFVRERQAASADPGELLERMGARLPVLPVGIRHIVPRDVAARLRRVDGDKPRGIAERQRPDLHRIDDAEHRAVDADAEREADDGEGGESRIVGERSDGVPKIL